MEDQKRKKLSKAQLKMIAKVWCKSILLANEMDSFTDDLLSYEDQAYIVEESHRIAQRITKERNMGELDEIIKKYSNEMKVLDEEKADSQDYFMYRK